MTPETNKGWELEFDKKCKESFALDGFLVKEDLGEDWSYDVQSIKNFIHSELQKAREEGLDKVLEVLSKIDTNEHLCRFNDAPQVCDCYKESLQKSIEAIQALKINK